MLLITSYFCIGTELRFLNHMEAEEAQQEKDSEFWHGKAVELSVCFLPGDAPIVKHIVGSYQKHHAPSDQEIPEAKELDDDVRVIKALPGVAVSKMFPIIQDVKSTSVKLSMLDIAPNDYIADLFESEDAEPQHPVEPTRKSEDLVVIENEKVSLQQQSMNNEQSPSYKKTRPKTSNTRRPMEKPVAPMNIDEKPFSSQLLTVTQVEQDPLDNPSIIESNSVETLN